MSDTNSKLPLLQTDKISNDNELEPYDYEDAMEFEHRLKEVIKRRLANKKKRENS